MQNLRSRTIHGFILGWVLMIFSGCAADKPRTTIRGSLTGPSTGMIRLLEMDPEGLIPVDSLTPDTQGSFGFSLNIDEPGFWVLQSGSGGALITVVHPGDHLTMAGSTDQFPDRVMVGGSKEAEALSRFFLESARERQLLESTDSLLMAIQSNVDQIRLSDSLEAVFSEILIRQCERQIEYLRRYPGFLSSILVVSYAFRNSPVMNYREFPEWYHRTDSALSLQYPGNKHVSYQQQRLRDFRDRSIENHRK